MEVLPLEIIDRAINQPIWVLLTSNREFTGTLVGFDDFVNVVIEDVVEYDAPDRAVKRHPGRMLLSGNNITVLVPGGKPPA
ncbi:AGR130Wp [Eremothecium gossypii ATCC 10895]|uniref:LSM complex subunit LSM5 n=1 Tax=Eremothecium gossypii (strain ATCC 10895 / CBS 109.51 / FGSC 9923 / NRRL Y-1056) TaxID=284811 RepID=Q74ZR8_EREGS|nr:AGR130Wp [Eremothecium gossypii ATCC 10895]AAS54620.1 AGR130Wp [Eremothecium gossypii ATCC 10895]AEY98950.1 FAGR130Wp [Eremothecium gossypii FDAG1]